MPSWAAEATEESVPQPAVGEPVSAAVAEELVPSPTTDDPDADAMAFSALVDNLFADLPPISPA